MKILMVEPSYKSEYVPLVFMRFSTYHKNKGDEVRYQKGVNWFLDFKPDIIYITSLFTWEIQIVIDTINSYKKLFPNAEIKVGGIGASLKQELVYEKTGIKPHYGTYEEIENIKPDYSLFPDINYSIGYTTKGCIRKCPWCMVHRLEPKFIEINNWLDFIDLSKEQIIFFDNNFTASSKEHQFNVLDTCRKINKPIDFNQSIDCRLFTDYLAELFSKTKINPIRFSMDTIGTKEPCLKAIEKSQAFNMKSITIDMLYNHMDTPEHFWIRTHEMVKVNVDVFPMKYQPLDTIKKGEYIGKFWNQNMLKNIRVITGSIFVGGVIGAGVTLEKFYETFGKDEKEFIELINMPNNKFKERALKIKMKWFKGKAVKIKNQRKLVTTNK